MAVASAVAVESHAMDGAEESCHAAGMDDYVSKPLIRDVFIRKTERSVRFQIIPDDALATAGSEPAAPTKNPSPAGSAFAFDLGHLRELFDNDMEMIREIVQLFENNIDEQMSELQRAIENADFPRIRRSTHVLRNAYAELGARTTARILHRLEYDVEEGDTSTCTEIHRAVAKDLEKIRRILAETAMV